MNRRTRKRLTYATITAVVAIVAAAAATITNLAGAPATSGETAAMATVSVVRVVDGDTIVVDHEGTQERVRLIGIDTPELGHGKGPDECFAVDAAALLEQLAPAGSVVTLRADPSQTDTDRYGRLVRHVDVDGMSVVQALLEAGAGPEYTYDRPYDGQAAYRAAESEARATGAGYWGACR